MRNNSLSTTNDPLKMTKNSIDQKLLDILACPQCKGDIELNQNEDGLICKACRLLYPIKDGIPVMLIDEAEKIDF